MKISKKKDGETTQPNYLTACHFFSKESSRFGVPCFASENLASPTSGRFLQYFINHATICDNQIRHSILQHREGHLHVTGVRDPAAHHGRAPGVVIVGTPWLTCILSDTR